eukprot:gene7193-8356_t
MQSLERFSFDLDIDNTTISYTEHLYPRNITAIYKGEWNVANGTTVSQLHFQKQQGHTLFSIVNRKLDDIGFDFVEGEMVIRDGIYTTDNNKKFVVLGYYIPTDGYAYLVALPSTQQITISTQLNATANRTMAENIESVKLQLHDIMTNFTSTECSFQVGLNYLPSSHINEDDPTEKDRQIFVKADYSSPFCRVDLEVIASSVLMSEYRSKWINYIVMVSLCSFIQIFVLIKQMDFTGTQSGAAKVSLYTVAMQTIIDAYLCLLHLTAGVVIESMFNAFAAAAFFQFVTFSLFEMRYLLVILKARRPQAFSEGWASLRREFSIFYLRFYTFLIGGFIIIYYMSHMFHIFLFIMYSFWVPQIVSNTRRSTRRPFLWQYVLGMSFSRLAIPLYFYGCPKNFIPSEPNYTFSIILFL